MSELLSGKKAMVTKGNDETFMLLENLMEVIEIEGKEKRKWIDPNIENFYPINGALSLAVLGEGLLQEHPLTGQAW